LCKFAIITNCVYIVAVTDPEIKKEIEAYYEGRRRLAIMMGCDPETFTEQDVNVSQLLLTVLC